MYWLISYEWGEDGQNTFFGSDKMYIDELCIMICFED